MVDDKTTEQLLLAARRLSLSVGKLRFGGPVAHVYNPLEYAWGPYALYAEKFGAPKKKVVFLGMNPGPFGMMQTGIPFGEIDAVRDWMKIECPVPRPSEEHPKRPIEGFSCKRSEVSGRRLWGLFAERFGPAEIFFNDHFVSNYCPLAFLESSGRNRTPDKLSSSECAELYSHCDQHLKSVVNVLQPEWVVGVGAFAENRARAALENCGVKFGRVLHPSPASPAANRDWSGTATKQLVEQGIWK